jgi:hypothetical protein
MMPWNFSTGFASSNEGQGFGGIILDALGRLPCELSGPLKGPVPADQMYFAILWWNEKQTRVRDYQKYLEWKAAQRGTRS